MTSQLPPQITDLERRLRQGKISRREFLRAATMLGLSLGAGSLAACSPQAQDDLSTDPLEKLYEVDYITATPDAASRPASLTNSSPGELASATPVPKRGHKWYCGCCGAHFRTLEDLKKHAATEHAWRIPEVERVDQPTYQQFLNSGIQRFDERNTVFSRTGWDTEFQEVAAEYAAKAPPPDWDMVEGYALVSGAIYVDATAGTLHPGYYGYFGHVRGAGGLYDWEDPVSTTQYPVEDAVRMSERIKQVARFYGADLVGITEVNPLWVYSHYYERVTGEAGVLEIPYKYAIVMGIEMKWQEINASPGPEASAATALAYSQMSELSASLAKYIRSLGYPAVPCGNDTLQSIPLAIDAGLGELGRNGLMLSPEFGPRQRICKVLTDLPLIPDKPVDFGIQKFCENCHACASSCPVGAIRRAERTDKQTSISNRPGILRWPVNVTRCYLFWQENGVDCSNCVAACPWGLHIQRDWLA